MAETNIDLGTLVLTLLGTLTVLVAGHTRSSLRLSRTFRESEVERRNAAQISSTPTDNLCHTLRIQRSFSPRYQWPPRGSVCDKT